MDYIPNHTEIGISKLITQYQGKSTITAALSAFLDRVQEFEDCVKQFLTERGIAVAVGYQLDMIGKWVGLVRGGRTDEDYRDALYIQIVTNYSEGTIEEMITLFKYFSGAEFVIELDQYMAGFTLVAINAPDLLPEYAVSGFTETNNLTAPSGLIADLTGESVWSISMDAYIPDTTTAQALVLLDGQRSGLLRIASSNAYLDWEGVTYSGALPTISGYVPVILSSNGTDLTLTIDGNTVIDVTPTNPDTGQLYGLQIGGYADYVAGGFSTSNYFQCSSWWSGLTDAAQFQIQFDFKVTTHTDYVSIYAWKDSVLNQRLYLQLSTAGKCRAFYEDAGTPYVIDGTYTAGQFNTFCYKQISGVGYFYLNGTLIGSQAHVISISGTAASGWNRLGYVQAGVNLPFLGTINDVSFTDTVTGEALAIYNFDGQNGNAQVGTNLTTVGTITYTKRTDWTDFSGKIKRLNIYSDVLLGRYTFNAQDLTDTGGNLYDLETDGSLTFTLINTVKRLIREKMEAAKPTAVDLIGIVSAENGYFGFYDTPGALGFDEGVLASII